VARHSALERAVSTIDSKDVIVSYSTGKDAMVVLDLAKKCAKRVEVFFLEHVPGISFIEEGLAWAEARWNVKIKRYPHWLRSKLRAEGCFCFHSPLHTPQISLYDIYAVARQDFGIELVVTGAKKADSMWLRQKAEFKFASDKLKAPILDWSTRDVLAYLKTNNLPLPENDGRRSGGIDLSFECVTNLYDNWPEDYARLLAIYPFAGAIIARRRFFGIPEPAPDGDDRPIHRELVSVERGRAAGPG
jgi:3'-phosphoadenosine 5'-phosphosulfate sulfotransferase (PAPS reductase)/FAD synthetase